MNFLSFKSKIIEEEKYELMIYNKIIINNNTLQMLLHQFDNSIDVKSLEYLFKIIYYCWMRNDINLLDKMKKKFEIHNDFEKLILHGISNDLSLCLIGIIY